MNLPAFPKALARLVAALPSYPPSLGFVTAGNLIAWPALRDLDWSPVFGRCLCIQIPDTGLHSSSASRSMAFMLNTRARPT